MIVKVRNVEPTTIVGSVYNGRKVIEYVGSKKYLVTDGKFAGKYVTTQKYKVRCETCGNESITDKCNILKCGCSKCSAIGRCKGLVRTEEQIKKMVDTKSFKKDANRNNKSGIKYLHSHTSKKRNYTIYQVRTTVRGKVRRLYIGPDYGEAKRCAALLQDIMSTRGVDGFIKWYDNEYNIDN